MPRTVSLPFAVAVAASAPVEAQHSQPADRTQAGQHHHGNDQASPHRATSDWNRSVSRTPWSTKTRNGVVSERLAEFADAHPEVKVRTVGADLSTSDGVDRVAGICATEPLTLLVNNAEVAHYMPLADLPADKAAELVNVKVLAPTMLARAAVAGMQERGAGTIVNVAGMIAFSGPAPHSQMPSRVVYAGTLAYLVTMSQTLSAELEGTGVAVQVVCPAWWRPSSTSARAWTSARCPG